MLVALVARGPVTALILLGVVLLVQQVEGHILQPLLLGRAVKVHPLAIVFGIATGTLLAGIIGALLAVPIVAVISTVSGYLSRGGLELVPTEPAGRDTPATRQHLRGRWPLSAGGDVGAEWAPSRWILSSRAYAASRASARSSPTRDHPQHPAAGGDHRAVLAAAGAGVQHAGQGRRPVSPSPPRGGAGVAGAASTTVTQPVGPGSGAARPASRAAACSSVGQGVGSRASTTWVSGSPKRALNSSTRGPAGVSASPT